MFLYCLRAGALCALLLMLVPCAHAHSGDHTFLDIAYEAHMENASDLKSGKAAAVRRAGTQMGSVLAVVPNAEGRTLLPRGTVCDDVELRDGVLTARFTLPRTRAPRDVDQLVIETIQQIYKQYFFESAQLTGIELFGREEGESEYRHLDSFLPPDAFPDFPETADYEIAPMPGPDYQKLYRMLQGGGAEDARVTGQSPLGTSGQPAGALSGRTVYLYGGHGYRWGGSSWQLERPLLLGMNEDHGNIDQVNFLAHYLFNAGATVVCHRPLGRQYNEVIVDNAGGGFSLTGTWGTSTLAENFNANARHIAAQATENATATFTPNIPAAGFYPVYCFANTGDDRVPGQCYRIRHAGGENTVQVNHRRVGRGWVWLGTYYFNAGSNAATGSVVVSNLMPPGGTAGQLVFADCIRFGNGWGNWDKNGAAAGGTSGYSRETEAGCYWLHTAQAPTSVIDVSGTGSDATHVINGAPRMSAWMRRDDGQGFNGDIHLSFHSNAANTLARGTVSLVHNSNPTTNQAAFATLISDAIDPDALLEAPNWEHSWVDRVATTLLGAYGEINNSNLNGEMCATLCEIAFHDNSQDAELLRDPKVRNVMARACMKAIIRYFNTYDSGPLVFLPEPPVRVRARNNGTGNIVVSWAAPPTGGANGGAATSYRVYRSTNGYAFDGGTASASTSLTFTGLSPGQTYYFRVAARNAGGESLPSEVVAARAHAGLAPVLVVTGYDRLDRFNNIVDSIPGGTTDRLFVSLNNSYDYVRRYADVLEAAGRYFDSCSNEAIISGDINLLDYHTVCWSLGEEATRDKTYDATERTQIQSFLNAGRHLFVSGSEIGYELQNQGVAASFYNNFLRASFVADSANTYQASGNAGSVFAALGSVTFDDGSLYYNVNSPDVINPFGGATAAMTYAGVGASPTLIHAFDTLSGWQDPNFSGQTNADAASTFLIVSTPSVQGSGSGDLFYVWGSGNFIREYNSSLPQFPKDTNFSIFVHGDNSLCDVRFAFRDPADNEIFVTPYTTVNWTGWQEQTALVSVPGLAKWAGTGDNAITGANVAFDSIQVSKASSSFASGHLYFDNATFTATSGGSGGTAAVQYSGVYKLVHIAFPFEAIVNTTQRESLMSSVLAFFGTPSGVISTVTDWRLY